jgi:hypothetical protein
MFIYFQTGDDSVFHFPGDGQIWVRFLSKNIQTIPSKVIFYADLRESATLLIGIVLTNPIVYIYTLSAKFNSKLRKNVFNFFLTYSS